MLLDIYKNKNCIVATPNVTVCCTYQWQSTMMAERAAVVQHTILVMTTQQRRVLDSKYSYWRLSISM